MAARDTSSSGDFLDTVVFNDQGLVPVIAQQHDDGAVLMMAWMNRDALVKTLESQQLWYWSRSRGKLWRKGETSGQTQRLVEMRVDCDGDTLLARVEQTGVACHTGRRSCFYRRFEDGRAVEAEDIVIPPDILYSKG